MHHTNILPPLPVLDSSGSLVFDNSTIDKFLCCPRAGEYGHIRKRSPAQKRWPLIFGEIIHKVLEYRYRMCSQDPCAVHRDSMNSIIMTEFAKHEIPINEYRNESLMQSIVIEYNKIYCLEDFRVLSGSANGAPATPFVELPFIFKLGRCSDRDIYYSGKIDLGISRNSEIFTADHKTSSMMGETFWNEQRTNPQHLGYMAGFFAATGIRPVGYMVNGIRPRPPAKSRASVINEDFQRDWVYKSWDEVDEWTENTLALIDELLWHYSKGFMPMKRSWCHGKYGPCEYIDVCSIPAAQRLDMLSSTLFTENTWSPLNKQ
jgi:hypothetical protein